MDKNLPNSPRPPTLPFKPLTEGLGFHPFSDGLPYAPVTKSPGDAAHTPKGPSTGRALPSSPNTGKDSFARSPAAGATAAGAPRFATSLPQSPARPQPSHPSPLGSGHLNRSVATPSSNLKGTVGRFPASPSNGLDTLSSPRVPVAHRAFDDRSRIPGLPPTQTLAAPMPQIPNSIPAPDLAPGLGYVLKRSTAYALDCLFNGVLFFGVLSQTLWKGNFSLQLFSNWNVLAVAGIVFCLTNWILMTLQEMIFGTTLGKKIFGLGLRGGAIALFLRALFFIPSAGFLGIGLVWSLFDRRRCCWHDRVVGIQPISLSRLL